MVVIIAGGRDFKGTTADIQSAVDASGFNIELMVNGCAPGVDTQAQWWAIETGTPYKDFPITSRMWEELSKRAGYVRNTNMAVFALYQQTSRLSTQKPGLIALWDGVSHGTKMMIEIARSKGFEVYIELL